MQRITLGLITLNDICLMYLCKLSKHYIKTIKYECAFCKNTMDKRLHIAKAA